MAYHIVEFEDGLQIVPSEWLTENNKKIIRNENNKKYVYVICMAIVYKSNQDKSSNF